jgi:hypothetical protein
LEIKEMPAKTVVKLKEALTFAKDNGYVFAVYRKDGNNYLLHNEAYLSDIDENVNIVVKLRGHNFSDMDFNEFTTEGGEYLFKLHNNFNLPKLIPIIEKKTIEKKKKTEEEIEIEKKCRNICIAHSKVVAVEKIKEAFPGCCVDICMTYDRSGGHTQKQFMGMMMWKNFNLSF